MKKKLYSVLVEFIDLKAEEPYPDIDTVYVLANDFNDAAGKAEKNYLKKKTDNTNAPVLTEDGSLNPVYLTKGDDFKIKAIEVQLLTEDLIT